MSFVKTLDGGKFWMCPWAKHHLLESLPPPGQLSPAPPYIFITVRFFRTFLGTQLFSVSFLFLFTLCPLYSLSLVCSYLFCRFTFVRFFGFSSYSCCFVPCCITFIDGSFIYILFHTFFVRIFWAYCVYELKFCTALLTYSRIFIP